MFFLTWACSAHAGQPSADSTGTDWSVHFQQTIVTQYHPDFSAPYTGRNSLLTSEPAQTSVTSTFFLGRRLWSNADIEFSPELAGGTGLSGAVGIAGFANGETFRIGDPSIRITVSRIFIRQSFPLGDNTSAADDGPNQIAGSQPLRRITLTAGKISMTDFFDDNRYSHDPRSQFLNWAMMTNGSWDYPADTRGYTWGIVAELFTPPWEARISTAMVPTEANKSVMDTRIDSAHSETVEITHTHLLGSLPGIVRLLGYHTMARMGNYLDALRTPGVDITATRAYGRSKYGFGINIEQALADQIGFMARAGWNDGRDETWMFTEIDRSLSLALSLGGALWNRTGDTFGAAFMLNGISADHQAYLRAGGYGFIIGDGALNYAPELITETYYQFPLPQYHLTLSPDYQFVLHPAYNRDRGPVHILGARAHVEL